MPVQKLHGFWATPYVTFANLIVTSAVLSSCVPLNLQVTLYFVYLFALGRFFLAFLLMAPLWAGQGNDDIEACYDAPVFTVSLAAVYKPEYNQYISSTLLNPSLGFAALVLLLLETIHTKPGTTMVLKNDT